MKKQTYLSVRDFGGGVLLSYAGRESRNLADFYELTDKQREVLRENQAKANALFTGANSDGVSFSVLNQTLAEIGASMDEHFTKWKISSSSVFYPGTLLLLVFAKRLD